MNGKKLICKSGDKKKLLFLRHNFYFSNRRCNPDPIKTIQYNSYILLPMEGGDFNCDGSDDQVEINEALAYVAENPKLTTFIWKGPNTYIISDSILIGSNTILEGESHSCNQTLIIEQAGPERNQLITANGQRLGMMTLL